MYVVENSPIIFIWLMLLVPLGAMYIKYFDEKQQKQTFLNKIKYISKLLDFYLGFYSALH
jgi:hypothetical protein